MGKLSFYFKKLKTFDFKNISRIARRVHDEHCRPYLLTMADIVWCAARYQAAPTDYFQSDMYRLKASQRRDIITAGVSNSFVVRNNNLEYSDLLNDKFLMYKHFEKYLKRRYIFISSTDDKNAFYELASDMNAIIVKPATDTGGGRGVSRFTSADEAWKYALSIAPSIAEDAIVQDEKLASLNPSSVNTIRPITLMHDGRAEFLAVFIRIGAGGVVDNFCDGGMIAPINLDTGVIEFPAADENVRYYEKHPITGTPIVGFQIPLFDEVKAMVTEAALTLPELRYIGWDVAVTPDGPCLIEGNIYPSHAFFNFAGHHPDGNYLRREFESKMK